MSDTEILQKIKEQLKADAKKYMQEGSAFYDFGFYAEKLLLIIKLMEEKNHPVKTYKDDFFEKFPRADRDESNYPCDCVNNLYGTDIVCVGENSCKDCWNREYKEEE